LVYLSEYQAICCMYSSLIVTLQNYLAAVFTDCGP
jgi:hypothetical protein